MPLHVTTGAASLEGAARDPREVAEEPAGRTDERPPRWQLDEGYEFSSGRHALRHLGGGHNYDAYLAWDDRLHSVIVAKLVRPHLIENKGVLEAVEKEAAMLARLNHPVIVRSYEAVLEGPHPHLALEHLEGPRLSTLLRKYGPLPVEQLVPLAVQLAAAIHYLRAEEVAHLDVKPSNIIMGAPPRLIDLSIARSLDRAAALRKPVGTDAYMSPEQCQPEKLGPVGTAADIWGLGVTLYRAATGKRPFTEPEDDDAPAHERWPQIVELPRPIEDAVPPAIAQPIMASLAIDPGERPAPAELAAEFETVLRALPTPRLSRLKPRLG
jgi:serine/threonine-protein kinase